MHPASKDRTGNAKLLATAAKQRKDRSPSTKIQDADVPARGGFRKPPQRRNKP